MINLLKSLSPRVRWVIGLSILVVSLGILLVYIPKPGDFAEEISEIQAKGGALKVRHFVSLTMVWAVGGSLVVSLILLILNKWWSAPLVEEYSPVERAPRYLLFVLLGIMALGGCLRWNLAHEGLWWDELWQTKNATVGYYLGEPDQPLEERRFLEGSFERTFWLYRLPTNHPIASIPARVMHLFTRDVNNPLHFNEFALRAPGFVAGLLTIGLLGWLGWRISGPRVATISAFLLAVHPWHIRYSIDLRSYTWVMLWTVMAMLFLHRISQRKVSNWGALVGLGVSQFLLVYSSVQTIWLAMAIFITTLCLALRGFKTRAERFTAASRVVFVHCLAAIAFLLLAAPLIPQIAIFLERYHDEHFLSMSVLRELIHELFWGELDLDLEPIISPVGFFIGWALLVFGLFKGIIWMLRRTSSAPIVISLFGGAVMTLLFYSLGHAFFYTRFIVYLLPPIALTVACGWTHWNNDEENNVGRNWAVPAVAGLALYLTITWPYTKALNTLPLEPLREVAELLSEPEVFPIGYAHGVEVLPAYLPALRIAKNRADLERYLAEAKVEGKTPMIVVGHEDLNRVNSPDGYELLDDENRFEVVESFDAIGKRYFYRVLRGQ